MLVVVVAKCEVEREQESEKENTFLFYFDGESYGSIRVCMVRVKVRKSDFEVVRKCGAEHLSWCIELLPSESYFKFARESWLKKPKMCAILRQPSFSRVACTNNNNITIFYSNEQMSISLIFNTFVN